MTRERLGSENASVMSTGNTREATSGSSKSGTGMPESSWGAGVTGFKTEVPGPSRRGLRRRKPGSDTQMPPPLGECQKLSVSPAPGHECHARSTSEILTKGFVTKSPPPDGYLKKQPPMWAAGRTITSTEKPTGAKTNDGVTKCRPRGDMAIEIPHLVVHRQKTFRPRARPDPSAMGLPRQYRRHET